MTNLRCMNCDQAKREHTYDGACYGICGHFVKPREIATFLDLAELLYETQTGKTDFERMPGPARQDWIAAARMAEKVCRLAAVNVMTGRMIKMVELIS